MKEHLTITEPFSPAGLRKRLLILTAVMLLSGALIILAGVLLFKSDLSTATVALVTCLISSLLAHVAGEYPRGDLYFTARLAIQMMVRTGLPFAVALWGLYFAEPPLETSLVFYMILFYLIGLVTDVQLNLSRLNSQPGTTEKM